MKYLRSLNYLNEIAKQGSIRKAADKLNLNQSALARRLTALEEDIGSQIFERLPRGVRLNTAGEILINHIRKQMIEIERIKSQIADLSGKRRGHVNISCSQYTFSENLPEQIKKYKKEFPDVTFNVKFEDKEKTIQSLIDFSTDIAIILAPSFSKEFQIIGKSNLQLNVLMDKNHPLASISEITIFDCIKYKIICPSNDYGIRFLLDEYFFKYNLKITPEIESDNYNFLKLSLINTDYLLFDITSNSKFIKNNKKRNLLYKNIKDKNLPNVVILIGQLQGRTLPVAAAKFIQELITDYDMGV
jgi:DNA-binding transcriptional LysR family regulator